MQRLNAIDAIAPAFTRTHRLLFSPFKLGRSWKLCASAYVAFAGSVFVPVGIFYAILPHTSFMRPLILTGAAISTLVFLIVFYLGARMELVQFEMVVTLQQNIAPMWRRYSARVWPTILAKVLLGTVITAALTPSLLRAGQAYLHFLRTIPHFTPGQHPSPAAVQAQMLQSLSGLSTFYLVFYGYFLLLKIFSTLLNDFVFPFYILEPITFVQALSRGLDVFLADPIQVILYLILKLILSVLGIIMYLIAFLIAEIVLIIPLVLIIFVGVLLGTLLTKAMGTAGTVLTIGGGIILYAAFILLIGYLAIGAFGYLLTLLESYGIFFLGGRYPLLGDLLEPPMPTPYTYTPPPPTPGDNEDDDGPPLPMDPALA